ncbi:alpha/beta fold hydrolase [uncultured Tateyamaria sp.]|uniref:alpha/beta fold hydrolase n=1 Tax=Tateyamaria sp. 1078 TaxID=3417464 RepID=UPI002639C37E|nr:alpha/beta fold hydrolase [uncultured Tateyamaria sp.]
MTGKNRETDHLRSLIFESIARNETFGTLIEQTDTAMQLEPGAGLRHLVPEFESAADAVMQTGAVGQGTGELSFTFDRKGRMVTGTASAISVFGLDPGKSLMDQLGESGQSVLEDLLRGRRSQATFTLFTRPQLRPVPVFAQSNGTGGFDAIAIVVGWNSAVAPLLKSGFQLTDTEVDVVEMLFRGHQPKDIAQRRNRALETVRTQVRTICRKTDTHGHVDIVHLVYGLIATTQFMRAERAVDAHGNYMLSLPSGRRMDVEVTGPDQGKPLLFLHGCLAGRRLPEPALARFRSRRIIAPGRPGHGQTPGDADAQVQDIAQDLLHMLDTFSVGQIDVVTYDLGAPFALWMAALAPDRIQSLTCLAPVPSLANWSDLWSLPAETRVFSALSRVNPKAARYLALLGGQRILRQGPAGFAKIVFANARFDQRAVAGSETVQRLFWHGHAWHVERGPDGFLADAALSSRHWDEGLPTLAMQPCFVVGAKDKNAPIAAVRRLAARVGARVVTLPDAGHSLLHASAEAWLDHVPE